MLLLPVVFPMLAAAFCYAAGLRSGQERNRLVLLSCLAELTMVGILVTFVLSGDQLALDIPGFCMLGLHLKMDGFRALYALIGAVMWMATGMFSQEYFSRHGHCLSRYYFFFLMTLGATLGVFLSADLYTTFIFFEIMSLTSYTWVAHEETEGAMRAAETYLAVAVIGGMVMLMGLLMLRHAVGTLMISELHDAVQACGDRRTVGIASVCILLGFGAKAGMFPLHIWLPKAHPVAPAPASALLSGILTKSGIYGVIIVSCEIFRNSVPWGNFILILGLITMVTGAVLAIFSVNMKRILACSSMSQIGFILVGIAMTCLLGEENALAARGTVLYMLNHSLFKLILFMVAGVVHMNLHVLDLNEIRGFGRSKPLLHFAYLMGMGGLMGVPLLSGYVSKTLIHEAIVEYAGHLAAHGMMRLSVLYTCAEWLFLLSGGMTAAYMIKLYICLFWEKNDAYQPGYDAMRHYMSPLSAAAIIVPALLVPVLGVQPNLTMDAIADFAAPFLHSASLAHAVSYFSLGNLKGALISIALGLVLYLAVIRRVLMRHFRGRNSLYLNLWPQVLDLENLVYRPAISGILSAGGFAAQFASGDLLENRIYIPVIRALTGAGGAAASLASEPVLEGHVYEPLIRGAVRAGGAAASLAGEEILEDRVMKPSVHGVTQAGFVLARITGSITDGLAALLAGTVLRAKKVTKPFTHVGNGFTYLLGCFLDGIAELLNRTVYRNHPREHHFVGRLAGDWDGMEETRRRMTHSLSFTLLAFGLGLCATLVYLVFVKGM